MANVAVLVSTFCFDHDYVYGLVPAFNFNEEQNVPTFYSSFAMLACAGALNCAS